MIFDGQQAVCGLCCLCIRTLRAGFNQLQQPGIDCLRFLQAPWKHYCVSVDASICEVSQGAVAACWVIILVSGMHGIFLSSKERACSKALSGFRLSLLIVTILQDNTELRQYIERKGWWEKGKGKRKSSRQVVLTLMLCCQALQHWTTKLARDLPCFAVKQNRMSVVSPGIASTAIVKASDVSTIIFAEMSFD